MRKLKIIYDYEKMKRAGALLNGIKISGVENIRILAEIADILDCGELSEETEAGTLTLKHGNPPRKELDKTNGKGGEN